jgi:hypothetical protein
MAAMDKYTLEELISAKIKTAMLEHYLCWLPSNAKISLGGYSFSNIRTIDSLRSGIEYLLHKNRARALKKLDK